MAYKWHHSRISLCISQAGTTQTAGARDKGGNFIGQLCIIGSPPFFWFLFTIKQLILSLNILKQLLIEYQAIAKQCIQIMLDLIPTTLNLLL